MRGKWILPFVFFSINREYSFFEAFLLLTLLTLLLFLLMLILIALFLTGGELDDTIGVIFFLSLVLAFFIAFNNPFSISTQKMTNFFIIFVISLPFALFFLVLISEKKSEKLKEAGLKGKVGEVIQEIKGKKQKGKIRIGSEIWWGVASSNTVLSEGEKVIVTNIEGMTLTVERAKKELSSKKEVK